MEKNISTELDRLDSRILAALQADARSVSIAVVMYTSRDGEAYAGQALTKGAVGILRKPVEPTELVSLLAQLDRARVLARKTVFAVPPGSAPARPRAAVTGVIDVPAELRRAAPPPRAPAAAEPASAPIATGRTRFWLTALAVVMLVGTTGWYYQRYQASEAQRARLQDELTRLLVAAAAETVPEPTPAAVAPDAVHRPALLETLGWALNQNNQYAWNEEPFDDARLSQLRELVARLTQAGFRGSVRLESHSGEFCLVRDEQGQLRLPAESTPFTRCEVVTYPPAQATLQSGRQSPAFARYLAQVSGAVRVVVAPQSNSKPLARYPESASVQTAGEWNQPARLNQRVEIVLVPAP